ncbi:MAG: Aminotransferase, DegT/DnrJ/EryC1/StrS family [Candidatus Rifleibacterium amylolyticum]|nr:MAG: Aminotransferase, DegT/DnrJ/EryC1/StrS family [Candidatus Rifleibacterium amylolyticum]
MTINVTRTYLPDRQKLDGYIDKIYESAWVTNNSRFCQELEARLKDYLGVKNLILVANGTLALQVLYKAMAIKGSVITTPFSFIATTSSLLWEGLRPVFADINAASWNIDTDKISDQITSDCSAIVPVHVFGNPCEIEKIDRIAQKHSLKVIYDGAHAFGVNYKGESVLNRGQASILSFHATKMFHTIEGGAIVTSDDDLAKQIRLMINFGITGPETIECIGINCKMNEFQAAMGLCILDDMPAIENSRRKVWEYYKNNLSTRLLWQQWNDNSNQNFHYAPVLFPCEAALKKAQSALTASNIFPRRYFYPSLNTLAFTGNLSSMPVSEDIASRILCLPIFSELAIEQQQRIVEIINQNAF